MTLSEARALFARGRAEVRGRGAITPAAFATAIVERGVDAGITGFLRFSLGHTTSANTFEPRFEGRFALPTSEVPDQPAEAMTSWQLPWNASSRWLTGCLATKRRSTVGGSQACEVRSSAP